jgi:hypothetical protein
VGQTCLGVIAGTGSGSMMTIEIGGPIERSGPVKNDNISDTLRNFRGAYCVFVEGCAWRLDQNGAVVCGWRDDEGVIREKIKTLAGRNIQHVEIASSVFDLNLSFDQGHVLHLFCDLTAGDLDNYSIRFPTGWYSVQPNGGLTAN